MGCYSGDSSQSAAVPASAASTAWRYLTRWSCSHSMRPAAVCADALIEYHRGKAKWIWNPLCFLGCRHLLPQVRHPERLLIHFRPCPAVARQALPAALGRDRWVQRATVSGIGRLSRRAAVQNYEGDGRPIVNIAASHILTIALAALAPIGRMVQREPCSTKGRFRWMPLW